MSPFDREAIVGEIAAKYGVLVDGDDPAFMVADIALLVIERNLQHRDIERETLIEELKVAMKGLAQSASITYSELLGQAVRNNLESQVLPPLLQATLAVKETASFAKNWKYWTLGACAINMLFGYLLGRIT